MLYVSYERLGVLKKSVVCYWQGIYHPRLHLMMSVECLLAVECLLSAMECFWVLLSLSHHNASWVGMWLFLVSLASLSRTSAEVRSVIRSRNKEQKRVRKSFKWLSQFLSTSLGFYGLLRCTWTGLALESLKKSETCQISCQRMKNEQLKWWMG